MWWKFKAPDRAGKRHRPCKRSPVHFHLWPMAPKQMPLRSADMALVLRSGAEWQDEHPRLDAKNLRWGERIMSRGARDAYTCSVMRKHMQWIQQIGARPCIICGEITACWCEACGMPEPMALCSRCDGEGLLCHGCTAEGKIHQEIKREIREDEAEVSGFHDDKGEFIVFNPPLKVKLTGVPAENIETYVHEMVAKHYVEVVLKEKPASSS